MQDPRLMMLESAWATLKSFEKPANPNWMIAVCALGDRTLHPHLLHRTGRLIKWQLKNIRGDGKFLFQSRRCPRF
jgi:hypothetical protein